MASRLVAFEHGTTVTDWSFFRDIWYGLPNKMASRLVAFEHGTTVTD